METQEQTQATNSVTGYDEAEGVTYEQQEPQQVETATEANNTQTAEEPEIAIQDGEVKFRDDFFGDIADEPETNEAERQKEPEEPEKVEEKQTQEPSENYYNHEELENLMGGNSSGHYHLTEAELQTVRNGGGGSSVEVVNNYTTTTTGKALDAVKGKDLNERVTALETSSGRLDALTGIDCGEITV